MKNISEFLKKIIHLRYGESFIISIIKEKIEKYINISIKEEDILVVGSIIKIKNTSQTTRSELFIKKENILKDINKNQNKKFSDIRW